MADDSIKLQKGYQLMLMHPELRDKFVAWQGYANMGKPQMHMAGKLTLLLLYCLQMGIGSKMYAKAWA